MGRGTWKGKCFNPEAKFFSGKSKLPNLVRVFVQYDQSLASHVRKQINESRVHGKPVSGFNYSTSTLLDHYLKVYFGATSVIYERCIWHNNG